MNLGVNTFDLDRLREGIKPFRLYWFPQLRSTSDQAVEMRKRGELYAPAIVLAGEQTAGRGRGSNRWWSARGCLTATFALPVEEKMQPHQIPLAAGLAARRAAAELCGDQGIQIKWPNDLLYMGKKLCGLLCERNHKLDLIGVGMNVNLDVESAPIELRPKITSLASIRGREIDMTDALIMLTSHLRIMLYSVQSEPFAMLLREYDAHHALLGKDISVTSTPGEAAISGRCEGMDEMGRLLVRSNWQLHRIIAGQVQMR